MKRMTLMLGTVVALACGGGEAASPVTDAQPTPAVDSASSSKAELTGESSCEILRSGILNEVFELGDASPNFRPGSRIIPHALCTASWDGGFEVSLTIMKVDYASAAEAVAGLEGTVEQLSNGITIKVGGKERTTKVEFEGWIDGVGDKANWAPKIRELQVAHAGTRFAVAVRGFGDNETSKAKAIEVAQGVIEAL